MANTQAAPAPGVDLRDMLAEAIYLWAPFPSADDPSSPMTWDDLPDWARDLNRARADALIAGPLAPLLAERATLTAERDAARALARDLHRRTQKAERFRDRWKSWSWMLTKRMEVDRRARKAETNLLDLAKMYGEACGHLLKVQWLVATSVNEDHMVARLIIDAGDERRAAYDRALAAEARAEALAKEAAELRALLKGARTALIGVIDAWDALPDGQHTFPQVAAWMSDRMTPAINFHARAALAQHAPGRADGSEGGADGR